MVEEEEEIGAMTYHGCAPEGAVDGRKYGQRSWSIKHVFNACRLDGSDKRRKLRCLLGKFQNGGRR